MDLKQMHLISATETVGSVSFNCKTLPQSYSQHSLRVPSQVWSIMKKTWQFMSSIVIILIKTIWAEGENKPRSILLQLTQFEDILLEQFIKGEWSFVLHFCC